YFCGVISNYDNSDDFAPVQPHYNQRDYRTLTPAQFLAATGDFVNHEQFTGITAMIGAWAGNTGNDSQDLNSHPDYGGVSTIPSNPFLGVDGVVIGGTTAFPAPSSVHLATGA